MVQVVPDARPRGEPRNYGKGRFPQMDEDLKLEMVQRLTKMKQGLNKTEQELGITMSSPNIEVQSSLDEIKKDKTVSLKNRGSCKSVGGRNIKPHKKSSSEKMLVLLMLLSCVGSSCATNVVKNLQQKLPVACYTLLNQNGGDCPSVQHLDFNERYNELNKTCCEAFHGKDVHCQMDYDKVGTQHSVIACLRSVCVKKCNTGSIVFPNNTDPYFKEFPLNNSYQGEDCVMSYSITYPYDTALKLDETEACGTSEKSDEMETHGTTEKSDETKITKTTPSPSSSPKQAVTRELLFLSHSFAVVFFCLSSSGFV